MQQLTIWLNSMVKCRYVLLAVLLPAIAHAQDNGKLTFEQAYSLAQQNYPLIRQKQLVQRTATLTIENIDKGFLPQFSISGQATYQSDVTSVPVSIPGIKPTGI